ncbi:hypothetical protein [Flavobacterium sp.]|uniref:hypothetical protein n=1 Tax=Flavobacterium sp. TaxID=239 RepID=UPI0031DB0A3A
MDIEQVKKDFFAKKKLTENELVLLFENLVDNFLAKGKFDRSPKSFYSYEIYNVLKFNLLKSNIEIPEQLKRKAQIVFAYEYKINKRELRTGVLLGVLMIFFGILGYFKYHDEFGTALILLDIALVLQGFIILFKRINQLSNLQKIDLNDD